MRGVVPLLHPLRHPPAQHLLHRGEVVLTALERADLEAAVIGLARRASLEHDHRGDGVGRPEVGDVEALDPDRQRVHPERLAEVVQGIDALLPAALSAQLVLLDREPGVALGELVQAPLVAALGVPQLDRRLAALLERLADHVCLDQRRRPDDLTGYGERGRVVLDRELLRHLRLRAPGAVLEIEALPVGKHAVADLEHLRVRVRPVDRDRQHVERADRPARDPLALEQGAHRPQPVAVDRGLLELLLLGGGRHRRLEVALDLAVVARQEPDDRVDVGPVVLLGDVVDAGRLAALDVVVEAGAAGGAARLGPVAGPVGEELPQQVERRADALRARERPEVDALGAVALPREVHARKLLVERDADVGVGLVVPQPDVERRPVLLDEALLGEQRLGLVRGRDEVDRLDAGQHLVRPAGRAAAEVRPDPLPDRLGLADVERAPVSVLEQVDAGGVGQRPPLVPQPVEVCAVGGIGHIPKVRRPLLGSGSCPADRREPGAALPWCRRATPGQQRHADSPPLIPLRDHQRGIVPRCESI